MTAAQCISDTVSIRVRFTLRMPHIFRHRLPELAMLMGYQLAKDFPEVILNGVTIQPVQPVSPIVSPNRSVDLQLQERQTEMRERMADQTPARKPPGRCLREIKPNEYYTPEELTLLGPSADTIRRLFKWETEGVNRLPRPETPHKRGYQSLWIRGSAAIAKLANAQTANSKKRPRR